MKLFGGALKSNLVEDMAKTFQKHISQLRAMFFTLLTITCSKSKIKTLEKRSNYV